MKTSTVGQRETSKGSATGFRASGATDCTYASTSIAHEYSSAASSTAPRTASRDHWSARVVEKRHQRYRAVAAIEMATSARRESSPLDRKSTRLNSSHMSISYAVFCLKKKKIR